MTIYAVTVHIIKKDPERTERNQLVYRASWNSLKATDFHRNCDGIANTLFVIKTKDGNIFEGFTGKKWNSYHKYGLWSECAQIQLSERGKEPIQSVVFEPRWWICDLVWFRLDLVLEVIEIKIFVDRYHFRVEFKWNKLYWVVHFQTTKSWIRHTIHFIWIRIFPDFWTGSFYSWIFIECTE